MLIVEPLAFSQKWGEPLFIMDSLTLRQVYRGLFLADGLLVWELRVGPWGVCRGRHCEGFSDFLCWKRWCWCGMLHFGRQCEAAFWHGKVVGLSSLPSMLSCRALATSPKFFGYFCQRKLSMLDQSFDLTVKMPVLTKNLKKIVV